MTVWDRRQRIMFSARLRGSVHAVECGWLLS
jgi:hypothetical protein